MEANLRLPRCELEHMGGQAGAAWGRVICPAAVADTAQEPQSPDRWQVHLTLVNAWGPWRHAWGAVGGTPKHPERR